MVWLTLIVVLCIAGAAYNVKRRVNHFILFVLSSLAVTAAIYIIIIAISSPWYLVLGGKAQKVTFLHPGIAVVKIMDIYNGPTLENPEKDNLNLVIQSKDGHEFNLQFHLELYRSENNSLEAVQHFFDEHPKAEPNVDVESLYYTEDKKIIEEEIQHTLDGYTKDELNSKLFTSEILNDAAKKISENLEYNIKIFM